MCNKLLTFLSRRWPTMLTAAVVLYATLFPDPAGAGDVMLFPGADKLVHAIMMGGLASAIMFDRYRADRSLSRRYITLTAIAVIAFSVVDELAQSAMQLGRTAEVTDFLADAGGVFIASLTAPPVIRRVLSVKHKRKQGVD